MDSRTRKAAVLIATLDPRSADALLEKMSPEQAQRVRNAVMQLDTISSTEEQAVLSDFLRGGPEPPVETDGGVELDPGLAARLANLPPPPADPDPAGSVADTGPFQFLHSATTTALAEHLRHEHPQVVAVVAAHLPPDRAAGLIKHFGPTMQADVLRRVAELDSTDPTILEEIDRQLERALADEIRTARNRATGMSAVAAILDAAGPDRSRIWESVQHYDRSLAQWLQSEHSDTTDGVPSHVPQNHVRESHVREIRLHEPADEPRSVEEEQVVRVSHGEPVRVDSAAELEPPDLSRLLEFSKPELAILTRALPEPILLLALAGAPPAVAKRLIGTLPTQAARAVRGKLTGLGPLRLRDIAEAQRCLMDEAAELIAAAGIGSGSASRFSSAA